MAFAASEGDCFLGLQNAGSAIEQVVQFHKAGAAYELEFDVAKRSKYQNPTLKVVIDGQELKSLVPVSTTLSPLKVMYTALGSSMTIRFANGSPSGDRTVFIDNVRVSEVR